MISLQIFV